jgi:hypothetical protein
VVLKQAYHPVKFKNSNHDEDYMRFCTFHKVVAVFALSMVMGTANPSRLLAQSASLPPEVTEMMTQVKILGLTANNQLVPFGRLGRPIPVTGVEGRLIGIDFRGGAADPAKRVLYGLSDTNKLYVIDPASGQAHLVGPLSVPFDSGFQSGLDFNPQADRLRLIGNNGRNFSVNVDPDPTGTVVVTPQTALTYATGDRNAGKPANVTGAAYTNNFPGTTATTLYDIDYDLDVLTTQIPPANGQLQTVGSLGYNLAPIAGFDIFTDAQRRNFAFTLSGKTLYYIDLTSGTSTPVGDFLRNINGFVGLAIIPG